MSNSGRYLSGPAISFLHLQVSFIASHEDSLLIQNCVVGTKDWPEDTIS